jgi:hypothetical protein
MSQFAIVLDPYAKLWVVYLLFSILSIRKNMRISSTDSKSWIEIQRNKDDDFPSFQFRAAIDIEHGTFSACNSSLAFLNLRKFAEEVDQFILHRELRPFLEGTYESYLKLRQTDSNEILITFCIGDTFCGCKSTDEFRLHGSFPIEQDILTTLASEFMSLSK